MVVVCLEVQMMMMIRCVYTSWRQHREASTHARRCDIERSVLLLAQGGRGDTVSRSKGTRSALRLLSLPLGALHNPTPFLIPVHPPKNCPLFPPPTRCMILLRLHHNLSLSLSSSGGPVPSLW